MLHDCPHGSNYYELNKHNKLMGMSNVNKHKKDNKAYIWFDIELVL